MTKTRNSDRLGLPSTTSLPNLTLADFGWSPFFQSQLTLDDLENLKPMRVMAVHRGFVDVAAPNAAWRVSLRDTDHAEHGPVTVGDWLLMDERIQTIARPLARSSLFKRRPPGSDKPVQLIAANVDTLFVVSSCNPDFNLARLERYLVLARDAGVTPIIVLTKADTCDNPASYAEQARSLMPGLIVEALDGRSLEASRCLLPWCGAGQTVAVLGSSGVGKSTLINTLTNSDGLRTQAIREEDAKGRHTTSGRSLHHLPSGGWLIDTPGMRELQLTDVESGLEEVFADIVDLAVDCKFSDCAHDGEPGCAVEQALKTGSLEQVRLTRYRKLAAEHARNSASLAERRARDKSLGKMYRNSQKHRRMRRDEP